MRVPVNRCARLLADRRGSVAVLSALCITIVIGFAALAIDVGKVFADRRKAQSTADISALVAAGDIPNAAAAARAAAAANGFNASAPIAVQEGIYVADAARAPQQRFTPAAASAANAVRVTLQTTTPLFLGRMLSGRSSFDVTTVATATTTAFASFAIGSRLLSLDGGLLNQILGSALGINLSLTAMDYKALVDAQIDLFGFMDAYAGRASITAGTYDSLLKTNPRIGQVLGALLDAHRLASGNNAVTTALTQIVNAAGNSTARVDLRSLVNAGPYAALEFRQRPKAGGTVSAFDLLNAMARLSDGRNQIAANVNAGVPGILSATLMLTVGEMPVGTASFAIGAQGVSAHTAQTRVLLRVQIAGGSGVAGVTLPLYVEIASGTAVLQSARCAPSDIADSTVVLGVTPGVVDAWIGDVSASDMTNFKTAPNPPSATLVNLALARVTGRAHATISNGAPTPVTFRYSDIQARTVKTVTTTSFVSSLLGKLLTDLNLSVQVLGLGLGLPSGLTGTVGSLIAAQTKPIDQLLANVLATVGVGIGEADVWVTGLRCDRAVLVH